MRRRRLQHHQVFNERMRAGCDRIGPAHPQSRVAKCRIGIEWRGVDDVADLVGVGIHLIVGDAGCDIDEIGMPSPSVSTVARCAHGTSCGVAASALTKSVETTSMKTEAGRILISSLTELDRSLEPAFLDAPFILVRAEIDRNTLHAG